VLSTYTLRRTVYDITGEYRQVSLDWHSAGRSLYKAVVGLRVKYEKKFCKNVWRFILHVAASKTEIKF